MKSVWKSTWALERRSHALLPVINAASVPGARRCRSRATRKPAPKREPVHRVLADQVPDKGSSTFHLLQNLRSGLETQAQKQDDTTVRSREHTNPKGRLPSSADGQKYDLFKKVVNGRFYYITRDSGLVQELRPLGIHSATQLAKEAHLFQNIIDKAFQLAAQSGATGRQQNPYFWSWRNAFINGDVRNLTTELQYSFVSFIVRQYLSQEAIDCHERLADMRFPHEWYPATRTMQRTIHLHVGPTNSGKTYNALKALENASSGIYAGPLRLLAHETFTRFKAKGKRCALVTGEEQRIPDGDEDYFASCTVEMTPLNQRVDVAVIDEIQMLGDESRGWAWTQALLGVQAKDVHLCGEERAVPLIEALCAKLGDKVIINTYKRLSSLQPMQESLHGDFNNLQKGDAIVSFSRVNLHILKSGIEQATGKKCAIVYGSLPPESRAQQAALFNDPDNDYDFLAASDAIGMGLNLEVKRVIFEAVAKHDGVKVRDLTIPELRQIGGRAGRFRTAAQANREAALEKSGAAVAKKQDVGGLVTTMEDEDLNLVHGSFLHEAEPLQTAGLFPPSTMIEKFASYFPAGTPFSFMLLRLRDIARLPGRFHLCDLKSNLMIAEAIQQFPMTIHDRCIFINAPCSMRDHGIPRILKTLARCVAHNLDGDLLNMSDFNLEILDYNVDSYPNGKNDYLKHLEALHKSLILYLWLSYRYAGVFKSQALAFHVKLMTEEKIDQYLAGLNYSPDRRMRNVASNRRAVRKSERLSAVVLEDVPSTRPSVSVSKPDEQSQERRQSGPRLTELSSDADASRTSDVRV